MSNYVDNINLNGTDAYLLGADGDRVYPGMDLTQIYAGEIAAYSDAWAWIKARIAAGNYDGMHVCDFIPFTDKLGNKHEAQIMGIDTYTHGGDTMIGHHIDFICRKLWPKENVQMNKVNYNNGLIPKETLTGDGSTKAFALTKPMVSVAEITVGGEANTDWTYDAETHTVTFVTAPAASAAIVVTGAGSAHPWLVSNAYAYLNSLHMNVPNGTGANPAIAEVDYTEGGVYYNLPDELKAQIKEKRAYLATRYKDGEVLSNDDNGAWANLGKLWIPGEVEVYGYPVRNTSPFAICNQVQYPYFAGSKSRQILYRGSSRTYWWVLATIAGGSTHWAFAYNSGGAGYYFCSGTNGGLPVCFRISA